jgi:hypothetical protein
MEDGRGVYSVLVGRREGKRPLGRPGLIWEDSIKMNFQEVGWGGMNWSDVTEYRDRWRALVNDAYKCTVF